MPKNINRVVILNNIRSNENVGSIFRTADSAGVSKIILVGITPTPIDRFGRENKGLLKASLGAEKFVKWEKAENLKEAILKLKNHKNSDCSSLKGSHTDQNFCDFLILGIEQDEKSIDYKEIRNIKTENIALVFGNEVEGLSKSDLKLCDIVAELPMLGRKESLNVAVCAGIILYSLM